MSFPDTPTTWRKSSRSQSGATCVELHRTMGEVRDSKNPNGPTINANMAALVRLIHVGEFN
ncbi:DUF397 domain-containing protein [Alloactinosynnema sp. L-07]|uniref:DUF397 domain-containing protein n=1 Tax=Alloactinosynnema sp. L-07 TaxID=1653480 RepID=UPI0009EF48DE